MKTNTTKRAKAKTKRRIAPLPDIELDSFMKRYQEMQLSDPRSLRVTYQPNPAWKMAIPEDDQYRTQDEQDEEDNRDEFPIDPHIPVAQRIEQVRQEVLAERAPVQTARQIAPRTDYASVGPVKTLKHVDRLLISDFEVKPVFRMGIEFEGMVNIESYPGFENALCDLCVDDEGECLVQFGTDRSIRDVPPGYEAIEIRTKVVGSRTGIKLFEDMLSFLWLASQTGDWLTNDSCGLHINLSEKNTFEGDKQADYYCHVLSLFDESGVLARYGRGDNRYCRQFIKDDERDFTSVKHQYQLLKRRERAAADRGADKWRVHEGKYLACSLRDSPQHDGYEGPEMVANRIEFRAIGGADYHLRLDDLDETVNHIISCVRMAYREVNR
jgi:hypothetical protein